MAGYLVRNEDMRPQDSVHFDICFTEGGFGGFPTAEKAIDFLRKNPGDYTNVRLLQVSCDAGRTHSVEIAFFL